MNGLKPLLYLTYRSLFNSVKRGLTTPRRLIATVFLLGYYFLVFMRPAMNGPSRLPSSAVGQLALPPLDVIQALVFGVMVFLSIFMLLGVTSANLNYRPADVDVLFPTPVSPRVVMFFRLFRDYLFVVFLPLILTIIGIKPAQMGWEAIFRNMPQYGGLTLRFMFVSWLLIALGWISLTYAISLYVNRSDQDSTRNRRILGWSVSAALIAMIAYIAFNLRDIHTGAQLIAFTRDPLLRVFFFSATFATEFTLAPFSQTMGQNLAIGLGGLIIVPIIGIGMMLRQIDWLYDQAAVRALTVQSANDMRRAGDLTGMAAQAARDRKGRFLKLKFFQNSKWTGAYALLWKELLLIPRTMLPMLVGLTVMGVAMSVMPVLFPDDDVDMAPGLALMAFQALVVMTVSLAISQTGFIEVLRRVDLQKPLPFSGTKIVWFEVASKSLVACLPAAIGAMGVLALRPLLWPFVVGSLIASPFFSLLMSSAVFLVTMIFPDLEDVSQRQFRGLMILLAIVITAAPPAIVLVGLIALRVPPYLAALAGATVCAAISFLLTSISGRLYAGFNPSE